MTGRKSLECDVCGQIITPEQDRERVGSFFVHGVNEECNAGPGVVVPVTPIVELMALEAENRWQNGRRDPERWPDQQEPPEAFADPEPDYCPSCGHATDEHDLRAFDGDCFACDNAGKTCPMMLELQDETEKVLAQGHEL